MIIMHLTSPAGFPTFLNIVNEIKSEKVCKYNLFS